MSRLRSERLQELYSTAWISRLKGFVANRYQAFGDWEGWFEEAHQNLALKIDRLPDDREISDAMIFAVFKNELISVKRQRLGYPRPRQWLREFSELGQLLFEWMCLQRLSPSETLTNALSHGPGMSSAREDEPEQAEGRKEYLERLIQTMIKKNECDGVRGESEPLTDELSQRIADADAVTEDAADSVLLQRVLAMLLNDDAVDPAVERLATDVYARIRDSLNKEPLLTDADVLILRCYYFQGLSQNDIAKRLDLPLQKVVRQREAAIARIHRFMEAHGFTREALL